MVIAFCMKGFSKLNSFIYKETLFHGPLQILDRSTFTFYVEAFSQY